MSTDERKRRVRGCICFTAVDPHPQPLSRRTGEGGSSGESTSPSPIYGRGGWGVRGYKAGRMGQFGVGCRRFRRRRVSTCPLYRRSPRRKTHRMDTEGNTYPMVKEAERSLL